MDKQQQANKFLQWININYDSQKAKLKAFCQDKKYDWNEDIYCDTYLKIYDKIIKYGIEDDTDKGFDAYMFMSFKINTMRAKQYASVQKRDYNITDIAAKYEHYLNNKLTQEEKLKSDLKKDFSTLYLMRKVEENFDAEHFYLFKIKTFEQLTYKQLQEKTGIKSVRQKILAVKNYLKQNVTKEEIDKEFGELYGDLFFD